MANSNGRAQKAYQIAFRVGSIVAILIATAVGIWQGIQSQRVKKVEETVQQKNQEVKDLKETDQQLKNQSLGSLEEGQKLCVVLGKGKTWRDGLIVPQNWNKTFCEDYMKRSGGSGYQLGCIKTSGTILGGTDGTLPQPNCGWQ